MVGIKAGCGAYQGSRYARIADQEGAIGGTADADEGCHHCNEDDLARP